MMICAVIKGPSIQEASRQIENVLPHANLIELRLDLFATFNCTALMKLRTACVLPIIFTLRSRQQEGGQSLQSDHLQNLRSLLALEPEYLDVESYLPLSFFYEIQKEHPKTKVICSYHDFKKTPEDLDLLYRTLRQKPAFLYKIAVMANSSLDALRLVCWKKQQDNKVIAISMGDFGKISRILAPVTGSPITYASICESLETAPGQYSIEALAGLYRYHSLGLNTKVYALIGSAVDESMSDETHNALMKAMNFEAIYVKIAVQPDQLGSFLTYSKELSFSGMSVTMPLKETVMQYLDQIDADAEAIGAVNTLLFENGKIKGFNTDGIGALEAIERCFLVKDKKIVLLGAGGAAKAIAYEACQRGAKVTILNRNEEKAILIAESLGCIGKGLDKIEECFIEKYDLLINCTSSSMPINTDFILPFSAVMDIKARPKESLFLKEARMRNCNLIYGYQMFSEQAVRQFALWFKEADSLQKSLEVIESKALELLGKSPYAKGADGRADHLNLN